MHRSDDLAADDLERYDWNDLVSNYEKHDIGEAYFLGRAEERGFDVEEWGIDRRHDSGEDGLVFDDKLDLKLHKSDELQAIVDIKTKSSESWMGCFNARHLVKYARQADEHDVPVFVWMTIVDVDAERVGESQFAHRIDTAWDYDRYTAHYSDESDFYTDVVGYIHQDYDAAARSFSAYDGNAVIALDESARMEPSEMWGAIERGRERGVGR